MAFLFVLFDVWVWILKRLNREAFTAFSSAWFSFGSFYPRLEVHKGSRGLYTIKSWYKTKQQTNSLFIMITFYFIFIIFRILRTCLSVILHYWESYSTKSLKLYICERMGHMSLQHQGRILRSGEVIIAGGPLPSGLWWEVVYTLFGTRTSIARSRIGSFFVHYATQWFSVSWVDGIVICCCCRCMWKLPHLLQYSGVTWANNSMCIKCYRYNTKLYSYRYARKTIQSGGSSDKT